MIKEVNKMTNKEHWKDKIVDLVIDGGLIAVINGKPALCKVTHCENCDIKRTEDTCYNELSYWANSEYVSERIQPEIKNCKVDDPILVSLDGFQFRKAHFKKYDESCDCVETFIDGKTSWSTYRDEPCQIWPYAKLSEESEE